MTSARVRSLVVIFFGLGTMSTACNSAAPKTGGFGEGGDGGGSGDTGGSTGSTGGKSGATGGKSGGTGGSVGTGGSTATGGSTGTGGSEGGGGGSERGAGGRTGGARGSTRRAGGSAGGAGGTSSACPAPYLDDPKDPTTWTCGNTCMRCSGGDPTIEKVLALTPPDGKMKVSQDYKLDSEASDPDSKPVIKSAI